MSFCRVCLAIFTALSFFNIVSVNESLAQSGVRNIHNYPECSDASMDPDGDQFGWENEQTCFVSSSSSSSETTTTTRPVCSSNAVDPDEDGWGWENGQSCIVEERQEPEPEEISADQDNPLNDEEPSSDLVIEAESGIVSDSSMKLTRFNGEGVVEPTEYSRGTINYDFQILNDGMYSFSARALSGTNGRNSFYYSLNSGAEQVLNTKVDPNQFMDNPAEAAVFLSSGSNSLRIRSREKGIMLDKLTFSFVGSVSEDTSKPVSDDSLPSTDPVVVEEPVEEPPVSSPSDNNSGPKFGMDPNFELTLPAGLNEVSVSSAGQLGSAISGARPGTVIMLEDGVYNLRNKFSWNATNGGTAQRPVVLMARNKHKAIIRGNGEWSLNAKHLTISGLKFESYQSKIIIRGDNSRFVGNHLEGSRQPIVSYSSNNEIANNYFTDSQTLTIIVGQPGIMCTTCKPGQHTWIHHNTFYDIKTLRSNGGESIMAGYGWEPTPADYDDNLHLVIENNLFDKAMGDVEVVSLKSSANLVRNNCFQNNGFGSLTVRAGHNNEIVDNQFIGIEKEAIRIAGTGNQVRGNYFAGNNGDFAISLHNRTRQTTDRFPEPYGTYRYTDASNNTISNNSFLNFRSFIRDYGGADLKHSEGNRIQSNSIYLTGSKYRLEAGRSEGKFLSDQNISGNTFLDTRPSLRSSCQ